MKKDPEKSQLAKSCSKDLIANPPIFNKEHLVIWSILSNVFQHLDPDNDPIVRIVLDDRNRSISIKDNGLGLSAEELKKFLYMQGEIAKQTISRIGDEASDERRYSIFNIADKIEVTTVSNAKLSKASLCRRDLDEATTEQKIPVKTIEVDASTTETNGTIIRINNVHVPKLNRKRIIRVVEKRIVQSPYKVTVFLDNHECQYNPPASLRTEIIEPQGDILKILGQCALVLHVAATPLMQEERGVVISSGVRRLGATLTGSEGLEFSEYIFGEIDIPDVDSAGGFLSPLMNPLTQLEGDKKRIRVLVEFIRTNVERLRKELVAEEIERKAVEERKRREIEELKNKAEGKVEQIQGKKNEGNAVKDSYRLNGQANVFVESEKIIPDELLFRVTDFDLSVRTLRGLKRSGLERIGDIVTLDDEDLLAIEKFGEKSFKEIYDIIRFLGFSLNSRFHFWKAANKEELAEKRKTYLKRKLSLIRKQLYGIDSSAGFENEVVSAIAGTTKSQKKQIVELWIGLDKTSPATLREVGDTFGLTRERIRQIVEEFQKQRRKNRLKMKNLQAAINLLEEKVAISEMAAIELLKSEGLSDGTGTLSGLLRAAELFGMRTDFKWKKLGDTKFICISHYLKYLSFIYKDGLKATRKWGCTTIENIRIRIEKKIQQDKEKKTEKLGKENNSKRQSNSQIRNFVNSKLIEDILLSYKGFSWLDQESGWFWIKIGVKNPIRTKINKILSVSPKIDIADLRSAISRNHRMEGFSPPRRVLAAFCEQLGDCQVIGGRTIVDKRPRDLNKELSITEKKMYEIFEKFGPVLSYSEAKRHCSEWGIRVNTLTMYLSANPLIRKFGNGAYTFIGAKVSPGEIEAVLKTVPRSHFVKVVQDYGTNFDGSSVWVLYEITEKMLSKGALSLPSAIKKQIIGGNYKLTSQDGAFLSRISLGDYVMWGFLAFFRRYGGEVGHYLRVDFNLSDETVSAEIIEDILED